MRRRDRVRFNTRSMQGFMNHPIVPFRIVLFGVLALTQAYLLFRIWQAMHASKRPRWVKAVVTLGSTALVALLFAVNAYIVVRRLPWVDPPLLARLGFLYPVAIWNFGSIFSAIVLAAVRAAVRARRAVRRVWRDAGRFTMTAPVDVQRRRFLQAGIGTVTAGPLLLSTYGAAAASLRTEVEEVRLPFGRRLRVVHLTDIHAGLYMTREDIRRYARIVRGLEPDVLALTGDYISTSMSFLPCLTEITRVRARHGTFVTLGNHEHWNGDATEVIRFFREHGVVVLDNAHRVIQTSEGPVAVAGIDDPAGRPDLDAALSGLDASVPTILLSHRPEVFPRAAARSVNLTLAGHWHGGQIKLEALGATFNPAHLLTPYPEGLYRIENAHLYVNRGIGTTGPPIRLNAPPEVALLQLT